MKLVLGVLELRIARRLCLFGRGASGAKLAGEFAVSQAAVSRAMKNLLAEGFVQMQREGKRKLFSLSGSAHAVAFRELVAENRHVGFEKVLAHSAVRVLCGMVFSPVSMEEICRVAKLPEVTVRRILAKMRNAGLVGKMREGYVVAMHGLKEFVQAYACAGLEEMRKNVPGSLVCRGPFGLLRSSGRQIPKFMAQTGISVFHNFGVQLILTDLRDYSFGLFEKKANRHSMENAVVHCLVRAISNSDVRENYYAMLVLHKNLKKVNKKRFLNAAKDFGISAGAQECLELVELAAKKEPWPEPITGLGRHAPNREEFLELAKQYA